MTIPYLQKKRIVEYLQQGKRFDGRKPTDLREIDVELNVSECAEGSCSVKFGNTQAYAGVKMSVVTPYADGADEGTLSVGLELGTMADDDFDMGAPGIGAIEMARVIDRGIRESGLIDWKKLCIKEGEKVWQISIDIYAINNDGNLFDVAALAALIALANAKFPVFNEETGRVEHKLTDKKLPLVKENMSFNLTIWKVGDSLLIDPSKEEEETADYRVGLALANNNGEPRITAMQKGKDGFITQEDMEKILNLVESEFSTLDKKIKKLVWN